MARRVLAIVAAVGMVVAAVAVRRALDDGDGGDARVVVVCDPDLNEACAALDDDVEVRTETSEVTSASLAEGSMADVDGWVTSAAWYEVAASRTDRSLGQATVLGTSEVVLAGDTDRVDALETLCGGDPVWRCVGDTSGRSWADLGGDPRWGPLRIGLPDPDTAVGLSVLASVAAGYFERTDFAANDFGELRGWLDRLAEPSGGGDPDLLTKLVRVRGTYSAGGLVAADAAGRTQLVALPAAPTVDAVAVLVDLPGGDPVPRPGPLRDALVAEGWDAGDGEPAPLLKPGVMAALHALWKETTS